MSLNPLKFLEEYIRFPSVSTDSSYKAGMEGARDFVCTALKDLGFAVEVVQTPKHPIVLGTRGNNPNWPRLLLYGHYDVQPADPLHLWTSPAFEPVLRGRRLYGRGSADNKGPQAVYFGALAKVLAKHPNLPLNITVLIEGEEEISSPSFPGFLEKYRERIKSDLILLSDTGSPSPEQILITTGLRGLTALEIQVRGPRTDLHSGIHGGALLNPIQALAEICASLHNPDGGVNVPGFYDDVVPPADWEREELKKYPLTEDAYRKFLDIPCFHPAPGYHPLEAVRFGPTLEFNGIGGGYQGEGSKTVIPSRAFAKITCRLVPNQDPKKIRDAVERTIRERAPKGVTVDVELKEGGVPYFVAPPGRPNTPRDQSPVLARAFRAAESAITSAFGRPPLFLREGGSVPIIGQLKQVTGMDSLMIGLFTPEDNLHAPDESFHLDILENGIEAYARIFTGIAGVDDAR